MGLIDMLRDRKRATVVDDPGIYLTTREAAKILRIKPDTLRKQVRAGIYTKRKTPTGQWRFLRSEIDTAIQGPLPTDPV